MAQDFTKWSVSLWIGQAIQALSRIILTASDLEWLPGRADGSKNQADRCPLLAQSGHFETEFQCLLLGVKRTLRPSYSPRTRRGGSRRISPSCRSWCVRLDSLCGRSY